jgi:hypothetical protein
MWKAPYAACVVASPSTLRAQEMEEVDVIVNYGKYHFCCMDVMVMLLIHLNFF